MSEVEEDRNRPFPHLTENSVAVIIALTSTMPMLLL